MIGVRISCVDGRSYIETKGHTSPIVCAAVSAIMQNAALGLMAIAMTNPGVEIVLCEMPEGSVRMLPPESTDEKTGVRPKRAE